MNLITVIKDKISLKRTMRRCKSRYRVEFTGRKWKNIVKKETKLNPELGLEEVVYVDINDKDEVSYMFNVFLMDRDVNLYLEFSDGSYRKIKLGRRQRRRRKDV